MLFLTASAQEVVDFYIIVNKGNSITKISKSQLSNIFLKKTKKWNNSNEIVPVDLLSNSKVRSEFSKIILNRTVPQVKAYWQQNLFSGKNTPPIELKNDNEVIEFVKNKADAIGYISKKNISDDVKIIIIE
jgi:ABC-type phosphate transport system substrate-binding protein